MEQTIHWIVWKFLWVLIEPLIFMEAMTQFYRFLVDPFLIQYRQDVDQLLHLSSDDPPIFISAQSDAAHPSLDLFHHSFHSEDL